MAKEKKAKAPKVKTIIVTPEEKAALKKSLKELKAERDAAISEHDKKKIKQARTKLKGVKLKLKRTGVPPAPPKEKGEAKPAEGAA
jgi:hypothetical protein